MWKKDWDIHVGCRSWASSTWKIVEQMTNDIALVENGPRLSIREAWSLELLFTKQGRPIENRGKHLSTIKKQQNQREPTALHLHFHFHTNRHQRASPVSSALILIAIEQYSRARWAIISPRASISVSPPPIIMHNRKAPAANDGDSITSENNMANETEATTSTTSTSSGGTSVIETEKLLPMHHTEGQQQQQQPAGGPTQARKVGTSLFYATSSLGVIFANKIVLSSYAFPSVLLLALFQFTSTTLALKLASLLGYVHILPISIKGIRGIFPLSTCYLLNIVTGLSATQNLSLPMMVLLRRASILMTMVSFACVFVCDLEGRGSWLFHKYM